MLLACTATALAACGLASREDNSKSATLSRTYPVEMQKLASCAFERLNKKYASMKKMDFPDRYMVKLRREAELITIWDIDLIAADQDSTRVVINSQKLETCNRNSFLRTSSLARGRNPVDSGSRVISALPF